MHYKFLNINDAFYGMIKGIHEGTIPTHVQASRYGECMTIEEPVILTYERPRERVLFNAARDANPSFQLYESLWMLAGRNDVAPLAYYNSRMKEFSDDGKTFNASYGRRWRHANVSPEIDCGEVERYREVDQLQILIQHLKANPRSRRAVLQMWNVEDDLLKIGLGGQCSCGADRSGPSAEAHADGCSAKAGSLDTACNLSACFLIRQGMCPNCGGSGVIVLDEGSPDRDSVLERCSKCNGKPHDQPRYLDITIFNRSNDLVWGALGANVVQFSVLQEYVAAHLGLEVGVYSQITNNLHAYTNNWKPEEWLAEYEKPASECLGYSDCVGMTDAIVPLVQDPAVFDKEVVEFVERHSKDAFAKYWSEPFLEHVAQPMMLAFHVWKRKGHKWQEYCLAQADKIAADDWRIACRAWLERRIAKRAQV